MAMSHQGWTKSVWPLSAGEVKDHDKWTFEATGTNARYRQLLGQMVKSTATSKQTKFRHQSGAASTLRNGLRKTEQNSNM